MKVWHKVVAAPAVAIAFLALLGAVSYGVMTRQQAALGDMYNLRFGSYQLAANSSQAISEVHSNVYRLLTWINNLKEDRIKQVADDQQAKVTAVIKAVGRFGADERLLPEERQLAQAAVKKLEKYRTDIETAIDLSSVAVETGMSAMQTADGGFQALLKDLNQLVALETRLASEQYEAAGQAFRQLVLALGVILVLALAVSAATAIAMSRLIVRPIGAARDVAQQIAAGDLTNSIDAGASDETGALLEALRHMNDSLGRIVGDVRTSSEAISTASHQIAAGNQDLSQRTEEQAASLEETAASMEELTGTVKQNAENAAQANRLAQSASEVAARGGTVVGQVVATMASINESSRKVTDIIAVIDGISFQTNILALNAAVEAARAGEQGRGFAVVAQEVRSLAQRSAAAAREIKGLIDDSAGKVGEGSRLVADAGQTMQEVVASIRRVSDIMAEIAAASQEQTRGIEQVNQAITQMDQVTQQNAALVEEASAAAQSMRGQAGALVQAVSVFKVDVGATATERPELPVAGSRPLHRPPGLPPRKPLVARPASQPEAAPVAAEAGTRRAGQRGPVMAGAGKDEWTEF
ncbi:HAMP domain-containing protein [Ramlibacter sp. RBP-2]|uniref:HAMP domain-containing protein n=1 Tax=Ramlibacter lithotrophicus TaxID=2606681 RepID=A0A7X6DFE1_9BURK|nr:methyl-accepting chemotaxis protein [Ramlibacter lithotrophicus]NKE66167.1 HAMP domain-containing protein [Ramlibacter lithotrophicus]